MIRATLESTYEMMREKLKKVVPEFEIRYKAELAYEINRIKEEKNAVILGHNYMEPALYHSVPDFKGDSLELSRRAAETDKDIIVFCGVRFMAETAKILSPEKTVLIPSDEAGCSLAASITGEDVRRLKEQYPGVPVVTYVNCYADVKAETDICCTSSNAAAVIKSLGSEAVIFLPDEYLAKNVAKETGRRIIFPVKDPRQVVSKDKDDNLEYTIVGWDGKCEVHEKFTVEDIENVRRQFPDVIVLAHPECSPEVCDASDFSGSTSAIINYVKESNAPHYLLLTECSMGDNIIAENPDRDVLRLCSIRCPHMGQITLEDTLEALQKTQYVVEVPEDIRVRAKRAVDRMLEIGPGIDILNASDRAALQENLLAWFEENQRDLPWRRTKDPYRIWVSEVMLQQTQVATVIPYFNRFVEKYPTISALAAADLQDILKSWEKMGYYARARNLHGAARRVSTELNGEIPDDYLSFRELPGVGEYIGAAVMSIAHNQPHPVVDGNVKRVLARLFALDLPVNHSSSAKPFKQLAEKILDRRRPGDFNQAMMELGATVCRPKQPGCGGCPLSGHCEAFNTGRQQELPVRLSTKPVPHYHIAVGVVNKGGRILITRRKNNGLLGGLWEFPGGKVKPGESAESACEREIKEEVNLSVEVTDYLTHIDHAYTHFKIAVDVYSCNYKAGEVELHGPVDFRWILVDEIDQYPFPGANHKFIPLIKQENKSR